MLWVKLARLWELGLNRCVDFAAAGLDERDLGNAVSLHSIASTVPDELCLVDRLRHYLLELADMFSTTDKPASKSGLALLLPELRRRDALIGCPVAIELSSKPSAEKPPALTEAAAC